MMTIVWMVRDTPNVVWSHMQRFGHASGSSSAARASYMRQCAADHCAVLSEWNRSRAARHPRLNRELSLEALLTAPHTVARRLLRLPPSSRRAEPSTGTWPPPLDRTAQHGVRPNETQHEAFRSWQVQQPLRPYDRFAYVVESKSVSVALAAQLARLDGVCDRSDSEG